MGESYSIPRRRARTGRAGSRPRFSPVLPPLPGSGGIRTAPGALRGLESDVADISSLQQKAVEFAKQGDFGAQAKAVNEELTQLSPDNEGAWTRLARCCLEAGQLEAASGALESALLLNPQNNLARSLLQEVIRRELLAEPAEKAPARPRKSASKKRPAEE